MRKGGRGTDRVSIFSASNALFFLCRLGRIGEGWAWFDSGVESVNGVLQTSRTFSSISSSFFFSKAIHVSMKR